MESCLKIKIVNTAMGLGWSLLYDLEHCHAARSVWPPTTQGACKKVLALNVVKGSKPDIGIQLFVFLFELLGTWGRWVLPFTWLLFQFYIIWACPRFVQGNDSVQKYVTMLIQQKTHMGCFQAPPHLYNLDKECGMYCAAMFSSPVVRAPVPMCLISSWHDQYLFPATSSCRQAVWCVDVLLLRACPSGCLCHILEACATNQYGRALSPHSW